MSPTRIFLLGAGVLLLAVGGYGTRAIGQQRAQLDALNRRLAQLRVDAARLEHERAATADELAQAERQLAELPPAPAPDAKASPERQSDIKTWLANVKKLRRLFEERPAQRIPEMQLLLDEDWLRFSRNISLDSDDDVRKALARIRSAATSRFATRASSALQKFVKAPIGDASATIYTLAPYFDPPVENAMLERYELLNIPGPRAQWGVQNKTPIDADYDSRYRVTAYVDGRGNGMESSDGVYAWTPDLRERTQRAYIAYAEANKGITPTALADALPYFNPPLDRAVAEKLLKAERERKP